MEPSSGASQKDTKLWFDTKHPAVFEEFYRFFTGEEGYGIPLLMKAHAASEKRIPRKPPSTVLLATVEEDQKEYMWKSSRINTSKDGPRGAPQTLDERNLSGAPNFPLSRQPSENAEGQDAENKLRNSQSQRLTNVQGILKYGDTTTSSMMRVMHFDILVIGDEKAGKKTFMR